VLRAGYVDAAAFEPDVHDIDVEVLLRAFLKRARERGLQAFFSSRIETPRRNGDRWQLQAGTETIEARVLINCAGAWADEFAGRCGARPLGFRPLRRTAALIDAPPGVSVAARPPARLPRG
jgi:D-arginine dehydrogenase